jgi:hypothetical protein
LWPHWLFLSVVFVNISVTGSSRFVKVAIVRLVVVMMMGMGMVIIVIMAVVYVTFVVVIPAHGSSSFSAANNFPLVVALFRLPAVSARHLFGHCRLFLEELEHISEVKEDISTIVLDVVVSV